MNLSGGGATSRLIASLLDSIQELESKLNALLRGSETLFPSLQNEALSPSLRGSEATEANHNQTSNHTQIIDNAQPDRLPRSLTTSRNDKENVMDCHDFATQNLAMTGLDFKALLDSIPTPPAQGWDTKKLGQICEILIGGTPARNNFSYFKGDNLWVSIAEMNGQIITDTKEKISDEAIKNSNVKLIPKNTTLLSFKLSIGKAALAGKDLYTNEAIAGLIPKNKNNLLDKFLFFIFKWQTVDLDLKGNNAFGKSLNSSILKEKVKIPLPPLEAQEKIISAIERIESKIHLLDSRLPQLDSKKSEILQHFLEA